MKYHKLKYSKLLSLKRKTEEDYSKTYSTIFTLIILFTPHYILFTSQIRNKL